MMQVEIIFAIETLRPALGKVDEQHIEFRAIGVEKLDRPEQSLGKEQCRRRTFLQLAV